MLENHCTFEGYGFKEQLFSIRVISTGPGFNAEGPSCETTIAFCQDQKGQGGLLTNQHRSWVTCQERELGGAALV